MKNKNTVKERQDGLENLVSEELKQIISGAMKKLRTRHKAVLVMRCYDGMPYSDIAESMGCSEFSTRMLFLRAKRALQRELSRNGLSKGTLLTALALFGKMTAPSEAAAAQISVTTAATKVGVAAGIAGAVTSKTAIVSLAAAGILTTGTVVMKSGAFSNGPQNSNTSRTSTQNISQLGANPLYYFPAGSAGPMILSTKSGKVGDKSYWKALQDDEVNYYYSNNCVYKNNYRMWNRDLSVQKLPTDDPKMIDFICQVEGSKNTIGHIATKRNDLLVVAGQNQNDDNNQPRFIYNHNALEEDYFQPNWPITAKVIDNRDQMHRRGWTYFRVEGRINGQNVYGTGRIPFVYLYSKQFSPWLKLDVGSLRIVDNYREAYISRQSSTESIKYNPGSFFKGLCRPWMGLHTIDTVRRDAAEQRVWFETSYTPDSQFAEVELAKEGAKIIYKIDMEKDVVDEITFSTDQGNTGNLKFSYLESVDGLNQEFLRPGKPRNITTDTNSSQGILWFVQLIEGSLK